MNLINWAVRYPIRVSVGVVLVVLVGLLSLFNVPIQLTPDVDRPTISVTTRWPGASPEEIEREIVDKQEEELKNLEGLLKLSSESQDSEGTVFLEFPVGTNIDSALIKTSNKLEQVREYPDLAEKPVLSNVNSRGNAIAWIVLKTLPGNDQPIESYRYLCEDIIKPRFERVPGVATSNIFGGVEREIHVIIDPQAVAARGLTISDISSILQRENRNFSAGDFDEGKRRYVVRTVGEFTNPIEIENVVLSRQGNEVVYLKDVAKVKLGFDKSDSTVRQFSEAAIAMNCQRATGANVIETMKDLQRTIQDLNENVLKFQGLKLEQVYDETIYIYSALDLIKQNIVLGGILAIAILFVFLRSLSSIFVIATAIPISVVGTFVSLALLGRNINVISLAGMSFAVGMVVDNSIVVLENIYRHLQEGKPRLQAAIDGTKEVWGAVLASTLTTMAVFLPILTIQEEAGQLFRDIAIAISCSVGLSLLVSITVIPTLSARVLAQQKKLVGNYALDRLAKWFVNKVSNAVHFLLCSRFLRMTTAIALTLVALVGAWLLVPPAEYLPKGNRNLIFGVLLPPPGYNLEELTQMGEFIENNIGQHFSPEKNPQNASPQEPLIDNFFYVARGRQAFMGAVAEDPERVQELIPLMRNPLFSIPGMIAIITQTSLFSREIGTGRSIELEITGPELPQLLGLAQQSFFTLMQAFPNSQMRPKPSLDLGNPEVHVVADRVKATSLDLDTQDIGIAVDVLLDGRKISTYRYEGDEIDLILSGPNQEDFNSQDLKDIPLITRSGQEITLGSVASITMKNGPEQINHAERRRAITISLVPPDEVPLESAMAIVREKVMDPFEKSNPLSGLYQMELSGTADDLVKTRDALAFNFILALGVTFLLMAFLFESYLYPLVIMFSVPLASVGGFLGLWLINLFSSVPQPLDVLTMLGFVILVGTVVNNAILIVHQALRFVREENYEVPEALRESVRLRIRPIFMSTATSVFGMLPLVLMTGAGSELYRGIGSVVVGGLVCSTLFTLFLIPTVFGICWDLRQTMSKTFKFSFLFLMLGILPACSGQPAAIELKEKLPETQEMAETPEPEKSEEEPLPEKPKEQVEGTLVLSLERCFELALDSNVEINLGRLSVEQRADDFFIAEEKFVPVGFVEGQFKKDRIPTSSSLGGASILKEDNRQIRSGIRKLWTLGTRTDLTWARSKTETNSRFTQINPFNEDTVGLTLEQPLLQGFGFDVNRLELERSVKNKEIADADFLLTLESKFMEIYRLYWELVLASQELSIEETSLELAQEQVEIAQDRLSAGVGASLELTETQASLARQEESLLSSQLTFAKSSDRLLAAIRPISREEGSLIQIIPSTEPNPGEDLEFASDLQDLIGVGLKNRVEIRRMDILNNLIRLDIAEARNQQRTSLDLTGAYILKGLNARSRRSLEDVRDAQNPSWSVGLNLTFLFDKESRRAQLRQALSRQRQNTFERKDVISEIIRQIREASFDLQTAIKKFQVTQKTLMFTTEQYEGERDRLLAGQSTQFEVERFRRDLLEAQKNHVKSRIEIFLARAMLETTTGTFAQNVLRSARLQE